AMKIGRGGYAYVVDSTGKLIAYPDISLVLRDTDFSKLPQVAAALAAPRAPSARSANPAVAIAKDLNGRPVLAAYTPIAWLHWLVFVEVPLEEAFAPLIGLAVRSGLLLLFALLTAALVAIFLARRLTGPIRALQDGAAQIGAGALDRRIDIRTGDEL